MDSIAGVAPMLVRVRRTLDRASLAWSLWKIAPHRVEGGLRRSLHTFRCPSNWYAAALTIFRLEPAGPFEAFVFLDPTPHQWNQMSRAKSKPAVLEAGPCALKGDSSSVGSMGEDEKA